MSLTADQITIAVTVYSRRQYLRQSIASALDQTVPVRVIVVEDCGPDAGLQDFVKREFGSRVTCFRNPHRRGLFGNWNACMEACSTPWLSILHDDDYLTPDFVEAMIEVSRQSPGKGLYFGQTLVVDDTGVPLPQFARPPLPTPWQSVTLRDVLWGTPFPFPGQIFKVDLARSIGGFRETSQYCGDWEMWCQLIARHGASQSAAMVACNRQHPGWDRGTNLVVRSGRQYPLSYVQVKRVLHLLRLAGSEDRLDRFAYQRRYQVPTRFLLRQGASLSNRLLRYHVRLLLLSEAPHLRYKIFQTLAKWFGTPFVMLSSRIWNLLHREPSTGQTRPALSG